MYRQRSYDNLQNGKSTSPVSSVSSGAITNLNHLNVTNSNHATAATANAASAATKTNLNNHPPPLNHLQLSSQSPSQYNNLSLSYVNLSPNQPQPQLYHHSANCNLLNLTHSHNTSNNNTNNRASSNNASFRNRHPHHHHQQQQQQQQQNQLLAPSTPTNILNNAINYATFERAAPTVDPLGYDHSPCTATVSLQSLLLPSNHNHRSESPVPIPTNFKYFAPQSKYSASGVSIANGAAGGGAYCYSDQSQLLGSSLGGGISPSTVLLRGGGGTGTMPLLKSQSEFLHNTQHQPQHPLTPSAGTSVSQQHLLQQQKAAHPLHTMSLNMTLPRYPYHRNRAIGIRKSSHDLQLPIYQHHPLEDGKQTNGLTHGAGAYSAGLYCLGNLGPGGNSTNSLNNHFNPAAAPGAAPIVIPYSNGLMLKNSSASSSSSSGGSSSSASASTATISSNSTSSATSSLDRRCRSNLLPSGSGSGSYLASYDTITTLSDQQQRQNVAPHTCPNSPRTIRCGSPSCSSELDPMLHSKGSGGGKQHGSGGYHRHRHHQQQAAGGGGGGGGGYAKFYRKPSYQMKSSSSPTPPMVLPSPLAGPAFGSGGPGGTNPVSPALSFSQFSPSFWSANTCVSSSNRSSMLSTASTLGGSSTPYVDCTNHHGLMNGSEGGGSGVGAGGSGGGMGGQGTVAGGGGGVGVGGGMGSSAGNNSPYVQRRGGSDKQRFSNVFEYQFNNFDLNSIHEDATNET